MPIQALHRFGLCSIAPCIIRFISSSIEVHTYLPRPFIEFSSPEEATGVMVKTGLIKVEIYRPTSGNAKVNIVTKEARNQLFEFQANLNRPLKKTCRILSAGGLVVSSNFKKSPKIWELGVDCNYFSSLQR